ncbi:hypothetical protein K461DRAFT_269027 [Myriangium duriaei CBS 260.36]|uniref:Autophagy-related protein 28 n=1 Tax=Myriangium duriaei CBS 260.36 TaxID=1168546 RepID=A0A9P4IYH9_9PEZI|nr:hypothetical protein K461DRAFT_269027 [Myriangium duriaei CBS 260.36]
MDSSWFSSSLPSASRLRDSFTSKMPASLIPPPITQSVYLPTNRRPTSSSSSKATFESQRPWYYRKQRNLEAELQFLLDAQAEALASGLSPPDYSSTSVNDSPSSTSSTPSLHSTQNIKRQGKIPLRDARKGLYMTMRRLALLKMEETKEADVCAETATASYEQVQLWTDRRAKLLARTQDIQSGSDAKAATELRDQAGALQPEIDDLEQKLLTLRNEQRKLRREAEDVENRVQAKMSSYTRNLEALDRDVQEFLRSMQPVDTTSTLFSNDVEEEEPFWYLPAKRRTLEMAREVLEKEKKAAETKQELVETEREALEEGAIVWRDAIRDVEGFERALRVEMRGLSPSRGQHPSRSENPEQRLQDLFTNMGEVAVQLESKLKLAETRGWKLLIAAVGAELDAFQKGRAVLEETLLASRSGRESPASGGEDEEGGVNSVIHSPPPAARVTSDSDRGHKIRELDRAFEARHALEANGLEDPEEDDGPDPELLISHHDTDTE